MEPPAYVTFDCYGTLIDFDLTPVTLARLGSRAAAIDLTAFLQTFEELRFQEVLGPYRPYREILARSLARAMEAFGLRYAPADGAALADAVPAFEPFPEVPEVLARLAQRFRLVLVSNTDDDLIAAALPKLRAPFYRVITAEQARAYKPAAAMFAFVLTTLGCTPGDLTHVAQGFRYDIMPTYALGWRRVWINRRHQPGDPAYGPYQELPDLSGVPALLGIED